MGSSYSFPVFFRSVDFLVNLFSEILSNLLLLSTKTHKIRLNMSSPAVKDLPTIDNGIKEELVKDHQLKKTSVTEKQVLPSADDIKAEKTHQGIMQGVETFSPNNLKETKTREPQSGADLMKTEMAIRSSLQGVEKCRCSRKEPTTRQRGYSHGGRTSKIQRWC